MAQENNIYTGFFTQPASAVPVFLPFRSGITWIEVINLTQYEAGGAGIKFYWQKGMDQGTGIFTSGGAGGPTTDDVLVAPDGFYYFDTSMNIPGPKVTYTNISNATSPVITGVAANNFVTGSIIRLSGTAGSADLMGIDWAVTMNNPGGTQATIQAVLANAPGGVGGGGSARLIPYNPYWYPPARTIVNITNATQAVVYTSVPCTYLVGQEIYFNIPQSCAMVEMNTLTGTIVAIDVTGLNFTVNIDSTNFTTFVFPLFSAFPTNFAQAVPAGEDTAYAIANNLNILADARLNTATLGILLPAGANSPGGDDNDEMFWRAGGSFSNNND